MAERWKIFVKRRQGAPARAGELCQSRNFKHLIFRLNRRETERTLHWSSSKKLFLCVSPKSYSTGICNFLTTISHTYQNETNSIVLKLDHIFHACSPFTHRAAVASDMRMIKKTKLEDADWGNGMKRGGKNMKWNEMKSYFFIWYMKHEKRERETTMKEEHHKNPYSSSWQAATAALIVKIFHLVAMVFSSSLYDDRVEYDNEKKKEEKRTETK